MINKIRKKKDQEAEADFSSMLVQNLINKSYLVIRLLLYYYLFSIIYKITYYIHI